jgi:hypothetical protein
MSGLASDFSLLGFVCIPIYTTVASSSNVKIEDLKPMNVQVTGLSEIRSDNFSESTNNILNEIDHYFKYAESSAFPKLAVQQGLYSVLRKRLLKL